MKSSKKIFVAQARQGDVWLERVERLPKNLTKRNDGERVILAYGEATGHHHSVLTETGAESFVDADGNLYLSCANNTVLEHQEHGEILVSEGFYKVVIQREYSPEAIHNVTD